MTQVAAEHSLTTFAEEEGEFDGYAEAQMRQLESILKEGQVEYLKHMLSEREMLREHSNQMVGPEAGEKCVRQSLGGKQCIAVH